LSDRRTAPLGCKAAPFNYTEFAGFYDGFAAERGQAPSPQSASLRAIVIKKLSSLGCSFAL
jgi:hypothetical protein